MSFNASLRNMDNEKSSASSPSRNPFSDSDLVCAGLDSDEQFVGNELKAFFDKEEKLYQSTLSVKSDYGEKSQVTTSGITMRSFMVDSGDSDLIQQKLTMSQYIAYRSEPLGQLGDSSFQERPYFSFQESNSSESEKSNAGVAEFNPDFSQEPSWMQKKSLSSLSSSENLEIPSKSPDCSENWLIGNNNNYQSVKEKMSSSGIISRECQELVEDTPRVDIDSDSQLRKKPWGDNKSSLSLSPELKELETKNQSGCGNYSGSDCGSSLHPENSVDESAAYKADEEEEDSPIVHSAVHQEPGEVSELPSFYWKPHENESRLDFGQSQLEQGSEKLANGCQSYVTGHVETSSFGSNGLIGGSSRHSDVAASTQTSSTSPASTVRENVDFQRYDSLCVSVSEPQLSSTREITDDCIDLGLSIKRVHFMHPGQEALRNPIPMHDTMLDATPNLCSTARSCAVATPAQEKTSVSNRVTPRKTEERNQELFHGLVHESKLSEQELERLSRDLTQAQDGSGFTPESWVAVFSNTSSLSTPLLMNKIKEHVIRQHSRGTVSAHVPPSNSSGSKVMGSMDDLSGRNFSSLLKPPTSNRASTQSSPLNGVSTSSPPVEENPMNAQPAFPGVILDSDSFGKSPNGRHTLASLPITSVQVVSTGRVTPVNDPAIQTEGFTRLTSTVKKKLPSPKASNLLPVISQDKASLTEKRKAIPLAPIVKCNKSHVYFGGCKVRQSQSQSLVVLNSSFKEGLRLELRIKDSQDFHIIGAERTLTSRLEIQLEPRQERTIDLVFRPNSIGPSVTKLNLYPRCESIRNLKYTVDLSGYGGSSKMHVGPDQILIPKRNATFWTCKIYLENHGNVDGFVCVQPFHEDGTPIDPCQCVILPQCFLVNAGSVKEVDVFIHPLKDKNATPFNLRLFWGDEPLRIRWMKCITKGAPLKYVAEAEGIDWTKLLHLGCTENTDKCDFGDEDLDLFYANVKTEKLTVIYQGVNTDSQFVTLAMETVTDTVLEPYSIVSGAIPSQRRVTTAICGKPSPSATLSMDVTELQFPPTRVGSTSSQKITLENKGSTDQEIHVKQITGPFSMVHTRSIVRSGFYTRLSIQFNPVKSGSYSGSVVLAVEHSPQLLVVALKGDVL